MRADELMIGDWVQDTCGNPIQVKELLEDGINGVWECAECYDLEALYDDIKPIPIDSDILEKNGWKDIERKNEYLKGSYKLSKTNKGWDLNYAFLWMAEIRFFHELQNIMRITGYQGEFKV